MDKKNINIKVRNMIHPVLMKILPLMRKEELVVDGEIVPDETVVIVANHLSIDDIPTLVEAVGKPFYVLVSDEDRKTFNGMLLDINGVHWVSRVDDESRRIVKQEALEYLEKKMNFAMYPEATWNLSPNLLMLPMNYGCCNIADAANVNILPVVTSFFDTKRISTIGTIFKTSDDLCSSISDLRDIMGEMVYKQMEEYYLSNSNKENIYALKTDDGTYYCERRKDIEPYYWENYVAEKYNAYGRARKDPDSVREYESQFIFEPKTDDYAFFQIFNSSIRYDKDGRMLIKRISSENGGYNGYCNDSIDYTPFFGYGYNEVNYKKVLESLDEEILSSKENIEQVKVFQKKNK